MSRYRSEAHSLRARIRDLEDHLDALDRKEGVGIHASTGFSRAMYHAGRRLGVLGRAALRWVRGGTGDETEISLLRARVVELERALAERQGR